MESTGGYGPLNERSSRSGETKYRCSVMVAHLSPKQFVRVQVLAPVPNDLITQLVEYVTFNHGVESSNLSGITNYGSLTQLLEYPTLNRKVLG